MTIGLYDTITLVQVVRNLKLPSVFLQQKFFPNVVEHTTAEFAIDVDAGKRRLAPFVSPLMQAKPVESRGVQTSIFAPAYIKDKRELDPFRPVMRAIGERIGGALSPMDREMANIAFEMEDQVQMINRRLEWMAANVLQTGTVTVAGDGYPTQLVNFGRDPSLTVTLAAGAAWTTTNVGTALSPGLVVPSENIEAWAVSMQEMSGAVATDLVFTPKAWAGFIRDWRVKEAIWFPRSGDSQIDLGGGIKTGAVYRGNWGFYSLWLYNDWYVDPVTDIQQPMLPDGTLLIGSDQMQGVRAFGAIVDPEFAYGAMAYAPKSWVEKDPARRFLMMQSAPMIVPSRVNASMCITVA